ncbi:MAG: AmmeMemoRadiSam system protein B, partial [Candidatus Aenigmarchaeota archaeon]|nr:AmmeMemoRadiSam system protein B [Candidatus Aenigmarchaeota archaeon]
MRMPVAHGFYPSKPEVLRNRVNELLNRGLKKEKAFGAIAPHAGYEYSGWVA